MLIEEGITSAQVAAVAAGADLTLRAGTAELMLLLEERGVSESCSAMRRRCVWNSDCIHGSLLSRVFVNR